MFLNSVFLKSMKCYFLQIIFYTRTMQIYTGLSIRYCFSFTSRLKYTILKWRHPWQIVLVRLISDVIMGSRGVVYVLIICVLKKIIWYSELSFNSWMNRKQLLTSNLLSIIILMSTCTRWVTNTIHVCSILVWSSI